MDPKNHAPARVLLAVCALALAPATLAQSKRTLVVAEDAPAGMAGFYANPVDAMDSITDASSAKPYVIKIHPGRYDLGGRTIVGKPYVDLEGSGQNVTTLVQNAKAVALQLVDAEEVRDLTLRDSGPVEAPEEAALVVALGAGTLRNVTVDGGGRFEAIHVWASARLDHVTARVVQASGANAGAVIVRAGSPVLDGCTLEGDAGMHVGLALSIFGNPGDVVTVSNSTLRGGWIGVFAQTWNSNYLRIRDSAISSDAGNSIAASGSNAYLSNSTVGDLSSGYSVSGVKCLNVTNAALYPVTCP